MGENLGRKETAPGWRGGEAEPAQGVGPGLLGCGEKNEQVDDAVLQGVEVLQGRGGDAWTTWAATSRAHLSPFPLQTQRASKQGCSIHAGLRFVSCADESRLPTKGVSHVPAVRSPSPFSTRMFQHSKPDPGSFAHKKRKRAPPRLRSEGWGLLGTRNLAGCPSYHGQDLPSYPVWQKSLPIKQGTKTYLLTGSEGLVENK